MVRFILKRILAMIPVIIGVSIIIFFILSMIPGDPATIILGGNATQEEVARLNAELGYDQPVVTRYLSYMKNVFFHLDFGKSYVSGHQVRTELLERAPISFIVSFDAILFASIIGIPLGVLSAVKQYSAWDTIPTFFALFLASCPAFWVGLMLMIFFCIKLNLLPTSGIGSWKNFILPMLMLGLPYTGEQLRFTRSSMLETIRQDYIRTARGKGAAESTIVWKHAMKNALLPIVTVSGVNIGSLMAGAVVTETIFVLPGLGTFIVNGIKQKDVPAVMGGTMFFAFAFAVVMLIVDLLYAFIDPRIKAQYMRKR